MNFTFRIGPANKVLWAVAVPYIVVLIVVAIPIFQAAGVGGREDRLLMFAIIVPLMAPLALILWLMSSPRTLHVGNGLVVLAKGQEQLDQIPLSDIAHVRLTQQRRLLELFDRRGNQRFQLLAFTQSKQTDNFLDYLRAQLPNTERQEQGTSLGQTWINRYVDFLPPTGPNAPSAQGYPQVQGQPQAPQGPPPMR